MLSTLKTILVLILLAGWALAGLSLHVVRLTEGTVPIGVIPKNRLGITDTYVDVRTWSATDLPAHADFVKRVIATDKAHWLKHIAKPEELTGALETPAP